LLPIEQLLSEVAGSGNVVGAAGGRTAPRPSIVASSVKPSEVRRTDSVSRSTPISPFAADSARKGTPRQEATSDAATIGAPRIATSNSPVILGSAAPASIGDRAPAFEMEAVATAEVEREFETLPAKTSVAEAPLDKLQSAVLQALADGNQRVVASLLESGEWSVEGSELLIKVGESQTMVDISVGPDAKRLAIAAASGVLGRAIKLRIVPGSAVRAEKRNGSTLKENGTAPVASGRSRAEQDAVVRRLQQKFGAQIRTVIDYKEKR